MCLPGSQEAWMPMLTRHLSWPLTTNGTVQSNLLWVGQDWMRASGTSSLGYWIVCHKYKSTTLWYLNHSMPTAEEEQGGAASGPPPVLCFPNSQHHAHLNALPLCSLLPALAIRPQWRMWNDVPLIFELGVDVVQLIFSGVCLASSVGNVIH